MVEKNFKSAEKSFFSLIGISFCILICSCHAEIEKSGLSGNVDYVDTEDSGIFGVEADSEETDYDKYYHDTFEDTYFVRIEVGEESIPLEISTNVRRYTDVRIKIDGQDIATDPVSRSASLGYAYAETKAYDFTGDGQEEVALIANGGGSSSQQAIRIFQNTDGKWEEMELPSGIYKNDGDTPDFVQKKIEELNTKLFPLTVYDKSCYISFQNEKNQGELQPQNWKIFINYELWADKASGPVDIGVVRKELFYSFDEKKFMSGDTSFIPASNEPSSRACADIWRMPRGSNIPPLGAERTS